ncbi:MAG: hydrogenase maturation protease [Planctomycetota bacterium]
MAAQFKRPVCIVGCGRWLRRDDEVGLRIARLLSESDSLPQTRIYSTEAPAIDIPTWLDGVELLVVIDAAKSGNGHPPGSWDRIDCRTTNARIRARGNTDTHGMSVDLALSLSESLGLLPKDVWIYAVVAEDVGYGDGLSPVVARAAPVLCDALVLDVKGWLCQSEVCHA